MGQIFEMKILTNLHILKSLKTENHIFSGWSLCVSDNIIIHTHTHTQKKKKKVGFLYLIFRTSDCYQALSASNSVQCVKNNLMFFSKRAISAMRITSNDDHT